MTDEERQIAELKAKVNRLIDAIQAREQLLMLCRLTPEQRQGIIIPVLTDADVVKYPEGETI